MTGVEKEGKRKKLGLSVVKLMLGFYRLLIACQMISCVHYLLTSVSTKEMHVGEEYQASVPPTPPPPNSRTDSHLGLEARMLWKPNHLSEVEVEHYQQNYSRILALAAPTTRVPDDEEVSFLVSCGITVSFLPLALSF